MLAGHPPFTGAQVEAVVRQHLTAEPPSVTQARPSVPEEVVKVIHRALSKSPADRFRTTGEMAAALAGTTPTAPPRKGRGRTRSVVYAATVVLGLATVWGIASLQTSFGPGLVRDRVLVIPFTNATGDPSLDEFAVYVTSLTADGLGQTGIVSVAPPEAVFESWEVYSEKRRQEPGFDSRRAIAEEFGAGILVEGSVLPGSDSLRIRVAYMEAERLADVPSLDPVSVPLEGREEGAGIENVVVSLTAALAQHLDQDWGPTFSRHFSPPPSLPMWREMQAASRAYYRRDLPECLRHIEAAVALDSTYLPVKVRQVVALMNMGVIPRPTQS